MKADLYQKTNCIVFLSGINYGVYALNDLSYVTPPHSSLLIKHAIKQFNCGMCPSVAHALISIEPSAPNYWHFVAYQLSIIVKHKELIFSRAATILVSNHVSFSRNYLDLLGIPCSQIIDIRNRYVFVNSLLYPPLLPCIDPSFNQRAALVSISEEFAFLKCKLEPNKKVFIERRSSNNGSYLRKVLPSSLWHQFLESNDFEIVYLDDMNVADQIYLFSQCETLIALHGAALTNIIYMKPGAKVIELMHHKGMENGGSLDMFMNIAEEFKLIFNRVSCESFLSCEEELRINTETGNPSCNVLPVKYTAHLKAEILRLTAA